MSSDTLGHNVSRQVLELESLRREIQLLREGQIAKELQTVQKELSAMRDELRNLKNTRSGGGNGVGEVWIGLVKKRDVDNLSSHYLQILDDGLRKFLERYKGKTGYAKEWETVAAQEKAARQILADAALPVRSDLEQWYGSNPHGSGSLGQGFSNATAREQVDSITAQGLYSLYYFQPESQHNWSKAGLILWTMALLCEYRLISV